MYLWLYSTKGDYVLSNMDGMCSDGFLHKLLGDNPNVEYIYVQIYTYGFGRLFIIGKMIEYVSSEGLYSHIEVN